MSEALQLLGGITVEQFLNEYWQKKPLLIRNAFPDFVSPLSADELAGLACEPEIESRIILEKDGSAPWAVEHGPFDESRFTSLPDTHWTLLVQGVDRWVPEVAELIESFRFIPDWRIDDIMISYAPKHGSVGPHLDQYDVFLIQAEGHRHWQINNQEYKKTDCIPDIALNILRDFKPEHEWTLAPGDMLYLPPDIAHYGVAQDECLTYSVGFRAPAESEILSAFIDDLMPGFSESQRYEDKNLQQQENPGEISQQALNKIQEIIRFNTSNTEKINRWFGRYITEPKNLPVNTSDNLTKHDISELLNSHSTTRRDMQSRISYIKDNNNCHLYFNGNEFSCSCELAKYISQNKYYATAELLTWLSGESENIIIELFRTGLFTFKND